MNFIPQPFQMKPESQIVQEQFQHFFPKGANWNTSQYYLDQTYEQFDRAVTTFFTYIQNQKSLTNLNKNSQISQSNLFSDRFNKNDFSLTDMTEQFQTAAAKLQISLQIILMPVLQQSYGNQSHQQAKIIIKQTINQKKLSFIFGLQNQSNLIQNSNQILTKYSVTSRNQINIEKPNLPQGIQKEVPFFANKNQNPVQSTTFLNNQAKQQLLIPQINQNNNNFDISFQQNFQINPQQNLQINPQQKTQINSQQKIQIKPQQNIQINPQQNFQIKQSNPQQNIQINPQQNIQINPQQNIQKKPQQNIQINPQQTFLIKPQQFPKEIDEPESVLNTILIQDIEIQQEKPNLNLCTIISNKSKTIVCDICLQQYQQMSELQILLPCCNRTIHQQCFQEELQKPDELLWNKKCYFCHQNFEINFLKQNIGFNIFQEIIQKQLLLQYFYECFNCKAKISILPEQRQKTYQIECGNCNTTICSLCMKSFHGFDKICQSIKQEIVKFLEGQPIIVCPFCDLIQTKDDGCNHVTCNQCKMDLCSVCSVDRRPILSHGNHFHRKGCTDYRVEKGKEKLTKERNRDCQLCKQNPDKSCHIPIDLDTYKKEKGF